MPHGNCSEYIQQHGAERRRRCSLQGVAHAVMTAHCGELLQALDVVLHDVAVVEAAKVWGRAVPTLKRHGRLTAGKQTRLDSSMAEHAFRAIVL